MDLFKITKSKTREKILQIFFADIDKKYYARQLEKILGLPVSNIHRELSLLEKTGLFQKEQIGNLIFYSLNKDSALFDEFKNIVFKTIGVEGTLRKELKKIEGIKCAFIFGSFAKNKEDSASDIDLMIIGDIDEDLLIQKISKIENEISREINYNIFSIADFKKGLAKKEVFLEQIVSEPKIFIIGNENDLAKIAGG